MKMRAVKSDGSVVQFGDKLSYARGNDECTYTFIRCESPTMYGKSGKIHVNDGTIRGRTLYAHIFGLKVEEID